MATDLLEWCIRHDDATFVSFLVLMGITLIAKVIVAIDKGVQTYRQRSEPSN
jgi:hypothetical protein